MRGDARPSATALLIAASLLTQARAGRIRDRIPQATLAIAECALAAGPWPWPVLRRLAYWRAWRWTGACVESQLLPGIQSHWLARKQRIATWLDEATRQGCSQLVVLGAGCDGLAAAFAAADPAQTAIELDHPATQALKRTAVDRAGFNADNYRLLACDLAAGDAVALLENAAVDPRAATFIVAEGLLMYLPRQRCEVLLSNFDAWFRGPLRIAFSHMRVDAAGTIGFENQGAAVTRWLRERGEAFAWGCNDARVRSHLDAAGFDLVDADDGGRAPQPPLDGWTACRGETLCLIRRRS